MKNGSLLGGVLLVSGTTIGAGMLALPVVTSFSGFYPSLFLLVVIWALMTFSAFLFLEVNLWMKGDVNLISMVNATLGKFVAGISWFIYLFLLYSLTTAYLAGGGRILTEAFEAAVGIDLPIWITFLPFIVIFGSFIYLGTRSVDYLNRLLMLGLALAYVSLVLLIPDHIQWEHFEHGHWGGGLLAISSVVTSFGFHIIIPTLVTYMDRDVKKLRQTIIIGSIIPLVVYILWEFLVLGIVPIRGEHGFVSVWVAGDQVVRPIREIVNSLWVVRGARCFSFFAIVTSFLGVSLSLLDFLSDFFVVTFDIHPKSSKFGKLLLCSLTFVPPLVFATVYRRVFFQAINYAGAFGVIVLLAALPALMVWSGRYYKRWARGFKTSGGRTALVAVLLCSIVIIGVVILEIAGGLNFIINEYVSR